MLDVNIKTEKLRQFSNDTIMAEAVYDVLQKAFLKKRHSDVQMSAAKSISLENLEDAWKEVAAYKKKDDTSLNKSQVGV